MEKETKYCLAAIIIATIWFLGQPMSGNLSVEVSNFDLSYFNLTNSTVSGKFEISGQMPIGTIILAVIPEIVSYDGFLIMYFTFAILFLAYMGYYLFIKNRRD